jgi:CheY-like chemotaxis protein
VRVAPGQFDQVILNLVANARDAIADDGTITVRTAEATIGSTRPEWPSDLPAGSYVALTVTDTGCGMTDDVRVRMFDPFFTTKGKHGTGIGLATVRNIVREAGGHIEVESAPEWGTSVRVYWPRADGPTPRPGPRSILPSRGETVLLVQDEQAVRDVGAIALYLAGYRVLEASDGVAGEERANLYTGPIDLLVTDLGLPRQGGLALAARVRSARPGMKVLYVSGSPTPDIATDSFLAKPYTPTELLIAVRAAIDSAVQE